MSEVTAQGELQGQQNYEKGFSLKQINHHCEHHYKCGFY